MSSRIDYVFTNDNLMDELIDHELFKEYLINSDHKLLTIKVRIRYEKERKIGRDQIHKKNKTQRTQRKKLNEHDWEKVAEKFEIKLEDTLQKHSCEKVFDDKNTVWEFITGIYNRIYEYHVNDKEKVGVDEGETQLEAKEIDDEATKKYFFDNTHTRYKRMKYKKLKKIDKSYKNINKNFTSIIISIKVYSQILTIKPDLRYNHIATLIKHRLYIICGATPDGKTPNYPFLFLNVSIPFDTKQLKWHDLSNLSNNDIIPSHKFSAAKKYQIFYIQYIIRYFYGFQVVLYCK
ncbi:hypothetical protein C1646_752935 [Rhizophagus diaphanus]|nr:hypothetical protein C1646_752935 [Rhizophagus diaphanus] [Rhizophagus sp. MUCL 43196]